MYSSSQDAIQAAACLEGFRNQATDQHPAGKADIKQRRGLIGGHEASGSFLGIKIAHWSWLHVDPRDT